MQVRDIKTGELENLRHGPATDAVNAGTHEFVNLDDDGKVKEDAEPKKKAAKREEPAK